MARDSLIQFISGLETNRTNVTPEVGEGLWTTDNKEFWIGDGTTAGGIFIGPYTYTHPTYDGDDISADTGALTGATVISDLDFNITTDTLGHVTDATLTTLATRELTPTNIGVLGFGTVSVATQSNVVADAAADTLTLVAGTNMTITTTPGSDTIEFAVSGGGTMDSWTADDDTGTWDVTIDNGETLTYAGGSGIKTTGSGAGPFTLTFDLDITELTAATAIQDADTFAIYDSGATANAEATMSQLATYMQAELNFAAPGSYDRPTSVLSGANVFSDIIVLDGVVTGTATRALTASDVGAQPAGTYATEAFKTISVATQSDVVADVAADTLTIAAGTGISITTNATTDTITITGHDLYVHPGNVTTNVDTTGAEVIDQLSTDATGHITVLSKRTMTLADLGYTGSTTANDYTHPAHPGDDAAVDTGALTGAFVISDLDFNVTTDALGHVTDANAAVSTRELTAANVGAIAIGDAIIKAGAGTITSGTLKLNDNLDLTFGTGNDVSLSSNGLDLIVQLNAGGRDFAVTDSTGTGKIIDAVYTTNAADSVVTIGNDLVVTGDMTVSGTTTNLNTTELYIEDNLITLNSGETGTPSANAGIEVERGTSTNVSVRWNEATDKWQTTNDGATWYDILTNEVTYLTAEVDTLATVTSRGATTATAISLTNTTNATTKDTGALIIDGGIGIDKDIFGSGYATSDIHGFTISGGTF